MEKEAIQAVLQKMKWQQEPFPQGKTIESIQIIRRDMIEKQDWLPSFLNVFHVTTRESVIQLEMLFQKGQKWNTLLAEETERNLRRLGIFVYALLVACKGKTPNSLRVLVITKDVWSLVFSNQFSLSGSLLRSIRFQPTEQNFLGANKFLGISFGLSHLDFSQFRLLDSFSVGQIYYDNRFLGTRLQFLESLAVYLNGSVPCGGSVGSQSNVWCSLQKAGTWNGFVGELSLGKPLYSLNTPWAFSLSTWISMRQVRDFQQTTAQNVEVVAPDLGVSLRTIRYVTKDGKEIQIPIVYDKLETNTSLSFSYSWERSHVVSVVGALSFYQYSAPEDFFFPEDAMTYFRRQAIPRTENTTSLTLSYQFRPTSFAKLRNITTFAISEDFSLGFSFSSSFSFRLNLEDERYSHIYSSFSVGYTFYAKDNYLQVSIAFGTRFQPVLPFAHLEAPWVNNKVSFTLSEISPLFWIGRFHFYLGGSFRWAALDVDRIFLGGDSGLRGYPSSQFAGLNWIRTNFEFRSIPLAFRNFHLGFVLFYDGGSAFGGTDLQNPDQQVVFSYKQSVGLGLRFQIPQLEKKVFRLDFAVPLSSGNGGVLTWFQFGLGQSF